MDGPKTFQDFDDQATPTLGRPRRSTPESSKSGADREPAATPLEAGERIGRYVVLGLLGAGGMGVVYAAYDPRLDRKVALKLLRRSGPGLESSRQARLLREAQALAKLNDPHVLTIYDVGTVQAQVFLAIEYVEGADLARWLRAEPRSYGEILRLFIEAGKGLASAHRQGLIHRDFKPSNVMVRADDGRALVLDFGLARSGGNDGFDVEDRESAADSPGLVKEPWSQQETLEAGMPRSDSDRSPAVLTGAGALLGTPLFMAPEQWLGEPGAAADQFSFCASLYLALYGKPPFQHSGLRSAPGDWQIQAPPENKEVPAHVRRLILRGLSYRAEDRFPSMEALLRELSFDPRRRRRLVAVAVGIFSLASTVAFFALRAPQPCAGAGERMAEVWNAARRAELQVAFEGANQNYGGTLATTVGNIFDTFAEAWQETYRDACEATQVRGDQSTGLMDQRMACLEERRRELSSLAELFITEPTQTIDLAIQAATDLSTLEECSDSVALMAPTELPEDPAKRQAIATLRGQLARNRALLSAGRYQEAASEAVVLEEEARALGYLPVHAEALVRRGRAEELQAEASSAATTYEEAVWVAQASHHDRAGAEALTRLVRVSGHLLADFERGAFFARLAESAIDRLDRAEDLKARLASLRGVLELEQGHAEKAAELHRAALEIQQKRLGEDHPAVARNLIRIATVLHHLGRFEEAGEVLEKALSIQLKSLGPEHPEVAAALDRLGNMAHQLGDLAAAKKHFARALEISESVFGKDHVRVAATSLHMATVLSGLGQHEQALALYGRARQIFEAAYGPDHPNVAAAWSNIGTTLLAAEDYRAALEAYEKALEIQVKALGQDHPNVATTYFNLGEVALESRDFEKAIAWQRKALDLWRRTLGEEHYLLGYGQTGLGRSFYGLGENEKAIAALEKALDVWRDHEQDPANLAWTHWYLAQAKLESDETAAIELARQALEGLAQSSSDEQKLINKIETWLAERGGH